jgi:hypothetical protein
MMLSLELLSHLLLFLPVSEAARTLLVLHDSAPKRTLSLNELIWMCRLLCRRSDSDFHDVLELFAHHKQYIFIDYLLHCHRPFDHSGAALELGIGRGDTHLLQTLLDDGRLCPTVELFHLALLTGHKRCVQMLIRDGRWLKSSDGWRDPSIIVAASTSSKILRLVMAEGRKHFSQEHLVELGKEVLGASHSPSWCNAAAAYLREIESAVPAKRIVELCIESDRIDLGVRVIDRCGESLPHELLLLACHEGALGIVKRLIARGLSPKKGNAAALRAACDGNSTRVILHLLKLDAATPDALDLALLHSVHANNMQVLRAVLRRVDFHPSSDVFVFACRLQRLEAVSLLVDDPRINPRFGENAGLLAAVRNGDEPLLEFLMRHPRTKMSRLDPSFGRVYEAIENPQVAERIYALS